MKRKIRDLKAVRKIEDFIIVRKMKYLAAKEEFDFKMQCEYVKGFEDGFNMSEDERKKFIRT